MRERGPGQMGQQMDKRAEPLICCTRGEKKKPKNTAAWPHPGMGAREESNTKAAMHSEVQEKRGEQQEAARPSC